MQLNYSKLPKASLFGFDWCGWSRNRWFMRTRGANYAAIWFGPIHVHWRMPWLPHVAAQLHPDALEFDLQKHGE